MKLSWDPGTISVAVALTAKKAEVAWQPMRANFAAGDSLSLADLYLFVVCNRLKGDGVDLSACP